MSAYTNTIYKKGGVYMCKKEEEEVSTAQNVEKLTFMNDIKAIIRKTMKEKKITPTEARKSLGMKRYEK